jgi:hypothetical protein
MPLWGTVDNAANSDFAAVIQMGMPVNAANAALVFENVTAGAVGPHLNPNVIYGQFGVDTNEMAANPAGHGFHAGWVLRKEGTGGRAGRVTYETLVATNSITSDGADNTWFPEYLLSVSTQPTSNTINGAPQNISFTVAASSTPSGAPLAYHWQVNTGSGWANVANTAGQYFNNTSPTFIANNKTANGNVFRALVTTANANSVTSGSATVIWYTP